MPELSSKIKKELRDYAEISNIKQLYTKYGVNNPEDAYKALNKEYKKEQQRILKEKAAIKAKEAADAALKEVQRKAEEKKEKKIENDLQKSFLKMRQQNKKEITIKLDKFKSVKQALELIIKNFDKINPDKLYNLVVGSTRYAINSTNRFHILDYIKKQLVDIEEQEGSDSDFVVNLYNAKSITIEIFDKTNKYKKDNGAFFPYTHTTDLDLTKYQVYNKLINNSIDMPYFKEIMDHKVTFYDNCLVYALIMGGLKDEKLQAIRLMCKTNNIPLCKFEEICKLLQIRINLKKMKKSNESIINIYGKEFDEIYNIGLLEEHYFINEQSNITSFALKNYFELRNIKDFNFIIKQKGKYYEKDKTKCIDSFELIKFMIENKDVYLRQINKLDITYTQNYNKVNNDITDLNYIPRIDINFRPVETKQKTVINENTSTNLFFDFETYTYNIKTKKSNNLHKPYLCSYIDDSNNKYSFYGEDCGIQMLKSIKKNYNNKHIIRLIAHNSSYDIRFLYKYLTDIQEITKGNKVLSCKCKFNGTTLEIKDSLLLISMPLKKFPKTFKIMNTEKEVISYDMYNNTDCINRRWIPIKEGIEWIKKEGKDVNQFIKNIQKWYIQTLDMYDCIEYSKRYCEMDCYILKEGYNTFKSWMDKLVNINIDKVLTIASLAHKYFIEQGCYKGVNELSSTPQAFIQKCVVGGRVMCSKNKKYFDPKSHKKIMDFDAVSLYPSAMSRMDGFLIGLPKVITNTNYDDLKLKDGYFIEIRIKSVGIKRNFPLMSFVNEEGIRTFTNDMIGKTMYIDKIALEDLINFQKVEFDIIRGYYFDEGFNTSINKVIKNIFNERVILKKNKNPAELVYKLIMNSGYGKSIMKEIENEYKYFNNEDDMLVFKSRNYNWVICDDKIADSNLYKVKLIKPLSGHFNIAQVGVSILSWSKRIMNEVMCLAEDNRLNIYYQDTDSMHIEEQDIDILATKFKQLYGRDLIGEDMGQFHSDFELEGCTNIYANRSIFLGKKCYIDELKGTDENGNEKIGYHIRMKGIPSSCITFTSNKLGYNNVFDLYIDLYNGKQIEFDLTENGNKANFKFEKNGTVKTLEEFKRKIAF